MSIGAGLYVCDGRRYKIARATMGENKSIKNTGLAMKPQADVILEKAACRLAASMRRDKNEWLTGCTSSERGEVKYGKVRSCPIEAALVRVSPGA